MAALPFLGTYGRFEAHDKAVGATLLGADSLVGNELRLEFTMENGAERAELYNRFGGFIGILDAASARDVQLCRAKEWAVHVLLASIYQAQGDEPYYWGEVVVLAFPVTKAPTFEGFVAGVARLLGEGVRPEVNLGASALEQIEQSGGTWLPSARKKALNVEGSVLLKDQLTLNEKLVEQARRRNPGCMAAGWLFISLLVLLVLWVLYLVLRSF